MHKPEMDEAAAGMKHGSEAGSHASFCCCFRLWIGYTMKYGLVTDVNGNLVGNYNSSSSPYMHFVDYFGPADPTDRCATAHAYSNYNQYKCW